MLASAPLATFEFGAAPGGGPTPVQPPDSTYPTTATISAYVSVATISRYSSTAGISTTFSGDLIMETIEEGGTPSAPGALVFSGGTADSPGPSVMSGGTP